MEMGIIANTAAFEPAREQSETVVAFNQGSDARLAGLPVKVNPFDHSTEWSVNRAWREGWQHVHKEWGAGVRGRWPFRVLPSVS